MEIVSQVFWSNIIVCPQKSTTGWMGKIPIETLKNQVAILHRWVEAVAAKIDQFHIYVFKMRFH